MCPRLQFAPKQGDMPITWRRRRNILTLAPQKAATTPPPPEGQSTECEHAPRRPAVHGAAAGALKSALSLIGRVKNVLYTTENIESRILYIRGAGSYSYRALRAVRGGCGKGALMGALRFVGV